jgi:hypothetical protein
MRSFDVCHNSQIDRPHHELVFQQRLPRFRLSSQSLEIGVELCDASGCKEGEEGESGERSARRRPWKDVAVVVNGI